MTVALWATIGLMTGAAVLHTALGLRRPANRTYLYFAGNLAFVTVFLVFALELNQVTTSDEAVEVTRRQVFAVLGCHACFLLFVPAYTRVRVPKLVLVAFCAWLALLFAMNLWAPYGLMFSGPPEILRSVAGDAPKTIVVAPAMSVAQCAYAFYFTSFLILSLWCGGKAFRRGERQRSVAFAIAVVLLLALNLVDIMRDMVGGSRPYVGELGFAAFALIMSVQLARDFRVQSQALGKAIADVDAQTDELASILDAMRSLERKMHAPLETLEARMAALTAANSVEEEHLERMRRAVTRLRQFANSTQAGV